MVCKSVGNTTGGRVSEADILLHINQAKSVLSATAIAFTTSKMRYPHLPNRGFRYSDVWTGFHNYKLRIVNCELRIGIKPASQLAWQRDRDQQPAHK
jgi:hypothetical protein